MNTYKIVIVGDEAVGKTTLTNFLAEMPIPNNYAATLGVEVHPARCYDAIFNLWDCAGKPAFGGLGEGYWQQSHGMIVVHHRILSQTSRNKIDIFRAMNPLARVIEVNITIPYNREVILSNFI